VDVGGVPGEEDGVASVPWDDQLLVTNFDVREAARISPSP
jgi:hypothetical protein